MTRRREPRRTAPALKKGGTGYGAYALGVLILAYVLAFVDRQLLGLLVQPLKRDLRLSDVQLGLLQGLGFALFLALSGLPIGRRVDTSRRITLVALSVVVWSLMTAGCGLAPGFTVLLLCRMGVGAGEAALTPAAYSLIGDYLPSRRLGLAVSLYGMGAYVGSGLALLLGGLVLSHLPHGVAALGLTKPWRAAFLILGLPGLLAAAWAATLREPARRSGGAAAPSLAETAAYFRAHGWTLAGVHLAVAFSAMALYALMAWTPAWFARSFHTPAGRIGQDLGLEVMAAGALGALSGGVLGDVLGRRGRAWRLGLIAVAAALALPWAIAAPQAASPQEALVRLAPLIFLSTMVVGAGPAVLQEVTPGRMRGVQHALAVLAVNLIGLGLGPLLVALVTDGVLHDERRLSLALALLWPAMFAVSAVLAAVTLRPYAASRARLGA